MKPIPSPDWYFRKYPNARNSSREWRKLRYEKALEIQAVLDDLRRV